jgi:hypothetical protein
MKCSRCDSERILRINAKHSDCADFHIGDAERQGYAPHVEGICGGDYTYPDICLNCGQTQGTFPKGAVGELEGPWCECSEETQSKAYEDNGEAYCQSCAKSIKP